MAASVSGIGRGVDLSVTACTRAVAGGANAAFAGGFLSFDGALDGGSCAYFEDGGSAPTAGFWYSAHVAFSGSIDMSDSKTFAVMHYRVGSSGFNDTRAVRLGLYSGSNLANYAYWEFTVPAQGRDGNHYPYIAIGAPTFAAAGWDNTDVTGFIPQAQSDSGSAFAFTHYFDQNLFFIDPEFTDSGGVTTVDQQDYYQLLQRTSSEDYRSLLVKTAGAIVEYGFPFRVTAADYEETNAGDGFAFKEADGVGYPAMAAGFFAAEFAPPAGGSQVFSNLAAANNAAAFDLVIDGSAAGSTLSFANSLFAGLNDVTISGANTAITATAFADPVNVTIGGVDFNGSITGVTNPIQYTSALLSGSSLTTDSDIDITFDVGDYTASTITFTGSSEVTVDPTTDAGTYNFSSWVNTGFTTNFDIPIGNTFDTTVEIDGSFTAARTNPTTGGGTITLSQPQDTLTITTNVSALIQIFDFGTQTLLASTTGTSLAYIYTGSPSLDIRVQNVDYYPGYTAVSPTGTLSVPVNLTRSNVYQAGSPLTYNTDIAYNRATQRLTLNTEATVREQFSALIDAFYNETLLYNTNFDFQMNGPSSLFLVEGAEYASDTDAERSTRGGIRYTDSGGVITAEWFAGQSTSSIDVSTLQARYQLQIGTGTTNAASLGDVDQVFKMYGDLTHGNFDYRATSPRFKMQPNGYYQADADIHSIYGISATEPVLYVFALSPVEVPNFTTGDPGITGISFTNNGATPVTRESLNWGALISDTNNNSGEDIQRWWNWNISQGGTLGGEDTFNLPDFIFGSPYQTNLGQIIGAAGTAQRGLWVERPSSTPHPDFFQQQSDSGTYYVLPVTANASVADIVAGSRIRVYNRTTATEIVNQINAGTSYSASYTNGSDYSDGDVIDVFLTYQSGTDARLGQQLTTVASASGWSVIASQVDDDVYILNGIDGSTLSEFTADYIDGEIDITSVNVNYSHLDAYAWWVYNLTTEQGIRNFFGGVVAEDAANYRNDTSVVSIFWDNLVSVNKKEITGTRFYRTDGVWPVKNNGATTGGGGMAFNWLSEVYLATTGSGPLTPSQEAQLSDAASNSATAVAQNTAIQGSGFNTATDSLEQISGNIGGGGDATEANQLQILSDIADLNNITGAQAADAILARTLSGGSDGGRTVRDALRANRNRVVVDPVANTITVYEEDDATVAWSGVIATGERDAINSVDPA